MFMSFFLGLLLGLAGISYGQPRNEVLSRLAVPFYDPVRNALRTQTQAYVQCSILDGSSFSDSYFATDGSGNVFVDTYTCPGIQYFYASMLLGYIADRVMLVTASATSSTSPVVLTGAPPFTVRVAGQPAVVVSTPPSNPAGRRLLNIAGCSSCGIYCCDPNEAGYDLAYQLIANNQVRTLMVNRLVNQEQSALNVQEQWVSSFTSFQRQENSKWVAQHTLQQNLTALQATIIDNIFKLVQTENTTNLALQSLINTDQKEFTQSQNDLRRIAGLLTTSQQGIAPVVAAAKNALQAITSQNEQLSENAIDLTLSLQSGLNLARNLIGEISDVINLVSTKATLSKVFHMTLQALSQQTPSLRPFLAAGDMGIPPKVLNVTERYQKLDRWLTWYVDPSLGISRVEWILVCDFQMFALSSQVDYTIPDLMQLVGFPGCPGPFMTTPNSNCSCWIQRTLQTGTATAAVAAAMDPNSPTAIGNADTLDQWPQVTHVVTQPTKYYYDVATLNNDLTTQCKAKVYPGSLKRVATDNSRNLYSVTPTLQPTGMSPLDACNTDAASISRIGQYGVTLPSLFYNSASLGIQMRTTMLQNIRLALTGTISNGVTYVTSPFDYSPNMQLETLSRKDSVQFLATGETMVPVRLLTPSTSITKSIILSSTNPNITSGANTDVDIFNPGLFLLPRYDYLVGYPECIYGQTCPIPSEPSSNPENFFYDVPVDLAGTDNPVGNRVGTVMGVMSFDRSNFWSANNPKPIMTREEFDNTTIGILDAPGLSMSVAQLRTTVVGGPVSAYTSSASALIGDMFDLECLATRSWQSPLCTKMRFYNFALDDQNNVIWSPKIGQAQTTGVFVGSSGVMFEPVQYGCPNNIFPEDDGVNMVQLRVYNGLLDVTIPLTLLSSPANPTNVPASAVSAGCFTPRHFTLQPRTPLIIPLLACGEQYLRLTVPGIDANDPPRICWEKRTTGNPAVIRILQQHVFNVSIVAQDQTLQRLAGLEQGLALLKDDISAGVLNILNATLTPVNTSGIASLPPIFTTNFTQNFTNTVGDTFSDLNQNVDERLRELQLIAASTQETAAIIADERALNARIAQQNAINQQATANEQKIADALANATIHFGVLPTVIFTGNYSNVNWSAFTTVFWQELASMSCDNFDDIPPNPLCNHWYDLDDQWCGETFGWIFILLMGGIVCALIAALAFLPGCNRTRRLANEAFFQTGICPPVQDCSCGIVAGCCIVCKTVPKPDPKDDDL